MIKKKLFLSILIFLIINLILVMATSIFGIRIATLSFQSSSPVQMQIFYTTEKGEPFNELDSQKSPQDKTGAEFAKSRFLIYTKYADKLRIDFGDAPANFKVNSFSVSEGLFFNKVWDKEQLKEQFVNNQQVEIKEGQADYFELNTTGNDGFISGDNLNGEKELNKEIIQWELLGFLLILAFVFYDALIICSPKVKNFEPVKKLSAFFQRTAADISVEAKGIKSFLLENKINIYILLFLTILAHGVAIFYYKIGIDSEYAIMRGSSVWGFVEQGRFGIALLKKVFFTDSIVIPAYNILLALAVLFFSIILSTYIINKYAKEKSRLANLGFMMMFITFSQIPTYITFIMYSFEVSMGYLFVALSMLFITRTIFDNRSQINLALGIIFLMLSISVYQCFIGLYVAFVCILFLIKNKNSCEDAKNKEFAQLLKCIVALAVACLIYFIINFALTRSFFNSNGYLGQFIGWKHNSFTAVVSIIIESIRYAIFGVYGFELLKFVYGALLVTLIFILFRRKHIINILCFIGFMLSPFLLNITLGSVQPLRALVALPFFMGMSFYGLIVVIKNKSTQSVILVFVLLCSIYQAQLTSQLYFGDYVRYNQDVQLGDRISERVEELGLGERPQYPVVYVGAHSLRDKTLLIRDEILGYSFFEWDSGSISRIRAFMDIIGHPYNSPSKENIQNAYVLSKDMPIWPDEESVKQVNDIIIVKLSEPSEYWKYVNGVNPAGR